MLDRLHFNVGALTVNTGNAGVVNEAVTAVNDK